MTSWKIRLRNTWLHPRYIGTVYLRAALAETVTYALGTLLDVGCGVRPYRDLYAGRVSRYIGIDWPPAITADGRPDVIADAQQLPFASQQVDIVLATELIEHLRQPAIFLEECRRVLRRGGILIVSAPFLEPVHEEPRDFRRYTAYGLRALVEEHGFSVKRIWARGGWSSVVIGSFMNQTLYNWINPESVAGRSSFRAVLVAPLLAILQWTGWAFDRVISSERYSLGYVLAAALEAPVT